MLRAESINGQLEGTIGATTKTQDSNTFVNADDLQISDMGSMGNFMGGKRNSRDENMTQMPNNKNNNRPQMQNNKQSFSNSRPEINMDKNSNNQKPQNFGGNRENSEMPRGFDSTTLKLLTVYIGILIGGLVIVTCFTRRRKK